MICIGAVIISVGLGWLLLGGGRDLGAGWLTGSTTLISFVLLGEAYDFDLLSYALRALFLQPFHEALVHLELWEEKVFVNTIKLTLHAQAD